MSDFIMNFTDSTKTSFVIKPYTTNGPASPAAATPLTDGAVSANTSLVLFGKGMWDYGERIQEDLIHILENFANSSAPAYPIEGQLWYDNALGSLKIYDGATWQVVAISSLPLSGVLDMNNFRIINVDDPVDPQDAVTLAYADTNYVNVGGDTMTGDLTLPTLNATTVNTGTATITTTLDVSGNVISNVGTPTLGTDAANKDYVDNTTINTLDDIGDVSAAAPTSGSTIIYDTGSSEWVSTPLNLNALLDVDTTAPAPVLNDVLRWDGAVWRPAAGGGGGGGGFDDYVESGTLSGTTLVLSRILGGTVNITGIAPSNHTHTSTGVTHSVNPAWDVSYLRKQFVPLPGFPSALYPDQVLLKDVIDSIDQAINTLTSPLSRRIVQGDGTTGPYSTGVEYETYSNKLSVFVNGSKKYASTRGTGAAFFNAPQMNEGTHTGLDDATSYDFRLRVNTTGAATTISLTPTATAISLPIQSVNTISDIFTVNGDYTLTFTPGTQFTVSGSTANDGTWTVATSTLSGNSTLITTVQDVTDSTADGTISVDQITIASLVQEIQDALDLATVPVTVHFDNKMLMFIPTLQGRQSAVEVLDGISANPLFATLASHLGAATQFIYSQFGSNVDIDTATTGPDAFTVSGDYTGAFIGGSRFVVNYSANNNGLYEVSSSSFGGGVTTINVTTAVTADPADTGTIYFARTLDYEENGTPFDLDDPGTSIEFTSAVSGTDLIEVTVTRSQ